MKAPWEERTWIDTFTHNKAFETHAVSLILAMNEIREEKKKAQQDNMDRAVHLAETYKMLGLSK